MTAYVDDMLRPATVRHRGSVLHATWSHLMADDTAELLAFAAVLGLKRAWIQKPATPLEHFDITATKRQQALDAGAVPIRYGESGYLTMAKRAGVRFDLALLRQDREEFLAQLTAAARPDPSSTPSSSSVAAPVRMQLSRSPGARLPANTVSVAAPTQWANPFRPAARSASANAAAVEQFREYLARNPRLVDQAREELAGLNLACWCAPHLACHADVWLSLINNTGDQP